MVADIAFFSYAIAAAGFLALSVLLGTLWRARPPARMLLCGSLLTLLWSVALAWQARFHSLAPMLLEAAEVARNGGWSAVLLGWGGQLSARMGGPWHRDGVRLVALCYGTIMLAVLVQYCWGAYLVFSLAVLLRIGMAVLCMLLVERLYRDTPEQRRWAIKFGCLGIGGMAVYDFYMYSDALLFHALNPELWGARGAVNALTVPLLAIATWRSASISVQLALSRPALLHSAALLGSALYLLTMGSAAYYLRYAGGSWGAMMQLTFLFGAMLLLAGMLFSGSVRASLKVFINKHFYRYNYDYREEWLRLTRTLSEPGPDLGRRSVEAVAAMVDSPAGALWIRRESGQCEPVAHWQMALPTACEPADSAFVRFIGDKQWLVDVARHGRDGGQADAPLPAWLQDVAGAWLVLPLPLHGQLFGFVLLLQPRRAVKLNWEVIDLLKVAGSQIASYLAQREAASALSLARQFESFNRLSTFVVHDLKNLVSQLSLLMSNAEKHRHNPAFQQDMMETVQHAVQKMRRLLHKLSRNDFPERAVALPVEPLLRQAVAAHSAREPVPRLEVEHADLQVFADPERLERVLSHLIQNAVEATPRSGTVAVRLARQGGQALIEIRDNGLGMSAEFIRERLFKPFDSTKPAGMGIGAFESREYIVELGGRLEVRSAPAQGTVFQLLLPVCQRAVPASPQPA